MDEGDAGEALPRRLKLAYGVGQIAKGIEFSATSALVLFFFNQVHGLPALYVGACLGGTLFLDAVTDPLMGAISDRLRGRWGRRHPPMIAAALPMGLSFAMLFSPPAALTAPGGEAGLAAWALGWLVALRLSLTAFFVPHLALGAEMSSDYDERTRLQAWRIFFTFLGTGLLIAAGRAVFFAPTPAFADGQLDPSAWPRMARAFGVVICASIALTALGTRSVIPRLPRPPADLPPLSARGLLGDLRAALSTRPARAFFAGVALFFVARGGGAALDLYLGTYFWRLGSDAIALPGAALLGVLVGAPLWGGLAPRLDKRRMLLAGMAGYAILACGPVLLSMAGWFPEGDRLKPALFGATALSGLLGSAAAIAGGSAVADLTDAHALETGLRQEGLFFGVLALLRKSATGLGGLLGGVALAWIAFPTQADPSQAPADAVTGLGLAAGPGIALLALGAAGLVAGYRLNRAQVAEIQTALADREV